MSEDSNTTKKGDTSMEDNEELTFESALEKLETHVRTLEQGELTLNESLHIFEDGMKLAKFCGKKLDEAEQKIEILMEKNGELVKEPFNVREDDE
jgi:exodeoxyribonuclease VII small subunit